MRVRHQMCVFAVLLTSASALVGCGRPITAREAHARSRPDSRESRERRESPPQTPTTASTVRRPSSVPLRDLALGATTLRQPRRQIVEVALAMSGAPSKGIDCSSFAQQVYATGGATLPRTVSAQLMSGTPVETAQLRPGDLVFFAFEKRPADHVGIYAGDDSFVHVSSAASAVRVESLHNAVFSNALVAGRRYVQ